METEMYFMLIF